MVELVRRKFIQEIYGVLLNSQFFYHTIGVRLLSPITATAGGRFRFRMADFSLMYDRYNGNLL